VLTVGIKALAEVEGKLQLLGVSMCIIFQC